MPIDIFDVFVFVGVVLIVAGLYLITPPAALIGLGSFIFLLGIMGARRGK